MLQECVMSCVVYAVYTRDQTENVIHFRIISNNIKADVKTKLWQGMQTKSEQPIVPKIQRAARTYTNAHISNNMINFRRLKCVTNSS